jgi:hypothetical protein
MQFPVLGSQNFIMLSLLPETNKPFVGCHSTHFTSHPWPVKRSAHQKNVRNQLPLPVNTRSSRCSSNAHIRTVESSLAVANLLSSGLKLNARMASRWPFQAVRLFMLGWKYLITPLWSAEAKNAPEWVNRIARIAVSCAWRIVSKLNVNPFHSVNSPLVDPVKTRRYSGVHYNSRSASGQIRWVTWVRRHSPQRNSPDTESCLSTCERIWCIARSKSFLGKLSVGGAENAGTKSRIYSVRYWYRCIGSEGFHTSIIYGAAGLMYGRYRGPDDILRNYGPSEITRR